MKLQRIRFYKRSVIVNWLISYISVLLVPIMISGIIYAATWHVVESEVNRANESVLQKMEQAIDSNLGGIERLSMEMALSKRLGGFINVNKPLTDNDYYDLVNIANDLRVYKMANDYIEQIYVYYKNSDTVLSTREHIDSRTLFETIGAKDDQSLEEWKAFFGKRYIQEYVPITTQEDGPPVKAVMFAKSVILDNPDLPGAVILFIIKDSKLLENIRTPNDATVAVLDQHNRMVASTGFEERPDFLAHNRLPGKNGLLYGDVSGEKAAVSYTTSDSTGWKYVSMIPAELFDEKMKYVKNLIYMSIGLSLLIGGLVTYLFLKKNYNPISVLIRSLSTKSGISFEEGSNEYGYLQEALNNTFAEKEKIGQRLERHRNAIRSHFLQGLLKGRLEQNVPVHESLAAHNIRLASPYFAVLLFHIDHYGKFASSGDAQPQKEKLAHFIMMNVAEEVAGLQHQAFAAELDGMLACIVNFDETHKASDLDRIAEQVKRFLLDHYHIRLTAAISGIHQELEGISRAYQEAIAALEYRLVMGSGEIIRYDELPSSESGGGSAGYYYPLHVEQQLINFVKTGDYEKSKAMIDDIIEVNVSSASVSVPLAKCLMFDLIGTLLKTMDEIGTGNKREFINRVNPVDRLIGCETIKDMKNQIGEVLDQVCRSILEDRSQGQSQLSEQVIAYVKQHYSSENLNITMIGEAFGLTPSYVSKQFKAHTGEALLEFINKTRLEEAKKLLTGQTMPIAEIARRVGYADINTFNRIFKKYEGITPGKFKEIV
ncbi:helix-turn-helix domain-containing protein [Paenibacillus allorhizosphaerae]|uniref:HTH-type transcriptional regulator YesS n=1 Tax=Paenibacillus allorhizosphaerae TaxID=2849866 RepID=A0ABN7TP68_9BACL|nr:helix-turn-helix domain-containing protein [Paenibacillus allorhizosphaerae]CAG7644389.1 HTH-type transcriptional regulator YesS [Paenibacillus allorhizosphaerae]